MADSLINATALEQRNLIAAGDVSVREVVTAHLDRIDEVNPAINAIVAARPRAEVLADADAMDRSEPTGPLHGLPVAVKDLEPVAGLRTSLGSLTTPDEPAQHDGVIAARLRAAGALIIGKTNTPEFGTGSHTFNEVYGLTRNPWNVGHSAGGSSGGAGAALAARMLPIADGSDLGGSLRNPAAFNNVVGLRPSIGRVPDITRGFRLARFGLSGPMGRTVADTALVLSALAGPDPADPLSYPDDPAMFADPLPSTTDAVVGWVGDLGLFRMDPEPATLARAAAELITTAGGSFCEINPDLSSAEQIFRTIRAVGYRATGLRVPEELHHLMKGTVRENIEFGRSLDVDDLIRVDRMRADLRSTMLDVFAQVDVLALPTTQVAPFPADQEYPATVAGVEMADYLEWMMSCCVITATECPAISIPAGFTADGLPCGLQLVAPWGRERDLLEIAAAIEAAHPWHPHVPDLAAG